ncbi:MAG: hypothetical protein AB8U44_03540 [Aaplasma endosymbiont of Hyalomma asiaticum]
MDFGPCSYWSYFLFFICLLEQQYTRDKRYWSRWNRGIVKKQNVTMVGVRIASWLSNAPQEWLPVRDDGID